MPNAVKAKAWLPGAYLAKTNTGGPDVIAQATVNGSTAVKKGDILTIASGVVTAITASPTAVYGVAMHDAAAGGSVTVALAVPENVFVARCKAGVASGAAGKPGLQCDIVGTGGAMTIDPATTTNKTVIIDALVPGDDAADTTTPGRFIFKFLRSQAGGMAAS